MLRCGSNRFSAELSLYKVFVRRTLKYIHNEAKWTLSSLHLSNPCRRERVQSKSLLPLWHTVPKKYGMSYTIQASSLMPIQSSAYGKCIVADYNNVKKDKCLTEFLKLQRCYMVRLMVPPYRKSILYAYHLGLGCVQEEVM